MVVANAVLNIRLPSRLKEQLIRAALTDGRSVSGFVVKTLQDALKAAGKGKKE